ncbi:MAG: hypothetical protein M9894_18900 [Planctomycetes bacterium]|nr:hypothetical protein [Planctomycetota bacterium]
MSDAERPPERPEDGAALRWTGAPRSRTDLAVYGVVAGLIVLALAGPPLAAALDPRLPVSEAYHHRLPGRTLKDPTVRDPWGTPFVHAPDGSVWSLGPDARSGGGDDLVVLDERDTWLQVYRSGTEGLFGLAVAIIVVWEILRALGGGLRAPRRPLLTEIAHVSLLTLIVGPLVVAPLAVAAHMLPAVTAEFTENLRETMLVPWQLAFAATIYLLTAAVLLGIRLRAPESVDEGQS